MSDSWTAPRTSKRSRRQPEESDENEGAAEEEEKATAARMPQQYSPDKPRSSETGRGRGTEGRPTQMVVHPPQYMQPPFERPPGQYMYPPHHPPHFQQPPPPPHWPQPFQPTPPYLMQHFQPNPYQHPFYPPHPPVPTQYPTYPYREGEFGAAASTTATFPPINPLASPQQRQLSPPFVQPPNIPRTSPAASSDTASGADAPRRGDERSAASEDTGELETESTSFSRELGKGAASKGTKTETQILDRRQRKNAQSRARAAKLRGAVQLVQNLREEEKTEEQRKLLAAFEDRRRRKNERSRQRAIEKKVEIERILAKPEADRTEEEKMTLEVAMKAKQKKNEGDRIRRKRIKKMGLKGKGGASTRGRPRKTPLTEPEAQTGKRKAHEDPSPEAPISLDVPEIPLSPSLVPRLPDFGSPTSLTSPGMMSNIQFPSTPTDQRSLEVTPGDSKTPGGTSTTQETSQTSQPSFPVLPSYQQQMSPQSRGQLQLTQRSSSHVQQQRHPDGSLSISIGGDSGFGDISDPQQGSLNLSEVSHLFLYGSNNDPEGPDYAGEEPHDEPEDEGK